MKKHENPAEANVRRDFFSRRRIFLCGFPSDGFWMEKVRRAFARLRMSKINRTSF